VIKIAVNIEHIIPMLRVIANPLIGPEPMLASTNAAISVVTFASMIVINARLYPDLTADIAFFPKLNSSFILSKIITFESIAIPIVRINPAIPGNVRVAPRIDSRDRIKITFKNNDMFAINPETL
tara:strand:- start:43 stop:417 length:375 start_codon:yes stop_codon:yes gene_type:complete